MNEPRNPFRMLTSEQIESDISFLRLFEPGAVELLPKDGLWNRVHIIRSSPGGGKTSLLRLFTPSVLLSLYAHRGGDEYKDLYLSMKKLGALGEEGPNVLGIMLSCSRSNYDSLEDLKFDKLRKRRLLFSLLDSRIILAALRGIMGLKRLEYPSNLSKISIKTPSTLDLPKGIPNDCNGEELYNWACDTEKAVYNAIDSFGPIDLDSLTGHDKLFSAFLLNPDYISFENQSIVPYILIMLDDCHKLTPDQRSSIFSIIDQRCPVGIWVAERLEALTEKELFSSGAMSERDVSVIELEKSWRLRGNKFEKTAINIGDKRAQFARNVDVQSFTACLEDVLENIKWQKKLEETINKLSVTIKNKGKSTEKYRDWIVNRQSAVGTKLEKAISWRTLEILIERDIRKDQKAIYDFSPEIEFAYNVSELEKRNDSAVRAAAELFLSEDIKLPYYFGTSRLVAIASSNIEQFLWLGANLFEEIISANLIKPGAQLSPKRQEDILKKTINKRLEEIPYTVRNGREVKKLLEAIGKFAQWETMKPNATYAPGVTGIAISMRDRDKLIHADKRYTHLRSVLSDCIAHNLIEPRLDQKCKGERWMILYLNRMLCVHFKLPVQYGGWREKSLDELTDWLEKGFTHQKRRRQKK